jgi:hypothetical protein
MAFCEDQLSIYVDQINSSGEEPLPHLCPPGVVCTFFDSETIVISQDISVETKIGFKLRTFLVPKQWNVTLYSHAFPDGVIFRGPVWYYDTRESGQDIFATNPTSYSATRTIPWDLGTTDHESMVYQMCADNTPYYLGPFKVERWIPQSNACDTFMNSLCSSTINSSSAICSCFQAKRELFETYGVELPPTCMDPNCGVIGKECCSSDGYRTEDMVKEGCSLTLCTVEIDIHGQDIIDSGDNTIYCSGHYWDVETNEIISTSTPIEDNTSNTDRHIDWYIWVLLGVSIIIAVFLFIYITNKTKS